MWRACAAPCCGRGGRWHAVEVEDRTGSTNADLLARALAGAPERRGARRRGAERGTWPDGPHLGVPAARRADVLPAGAAGGGAAHSLRGWLALLAGVAVASAVTAETGVATRLKWPNDVLAWRLPGAAKLGGILAEAAGDAIVVGVGLNVSTEPGELPPPGPGALAATSLRIAGSAAQEREPLLTAILAAFERWYLLWRRADGDPGRCGLRAEYTRLSGTIGRRVRAELPGGQALSGLAVGVEQDGRLLIRVSPDAELPIAAGDAVHLR